jgi:hypothetical protein
MVPDRHRDDASAPRASRRWLLRRAGGAAAAGLAAATAGCAGALPPLGSEQRFGRVDSPPADPPRFRRWLPAPDAVDGRDAYAWRYRRPSPLDGPEPVRFAVPRKRLRADLDHLGIGPDRTDDLLVTPFGTVVRGTFDPATVGRTLRRSGYEPAGTYRGYDRFAREDVRRRAAVAAGTVVWTSERVHDRPAHGALIDARDGRRRRYHEADAAVERLTDRVGASRAVELIPPSEARYWHSVEAFRFDGGAAYHVRTFRYPEGRSVPETDLRDRFRRGTVLTREVDHSDLRVDGRTVTVEGRIPAGRGIAPAELRPLPPRVTWGATVADDAVTLRHEAGEPVPAADLAARFALARDPSDLWVRDRPRPLPTEGTLGPGDEVRIDVSAPTVRVVDPGEGDGSDPPDEAGERRPATRIEFEYADWGPVFGVDLVRGDR